jgi:hypothetical protein
MVPAIRYIKQKDIDLEKWDACIGQAPNGTIYAFSFYLNFMADQWDALVWEDYKAVMPLPWRKKSGISYLYYPFLTAQLGVFGNDLSEELFEEFLRAIPKNFKYLDLTFNHGNRYFPKGFSFYERVNFVLPLHDPYEALYKNYRENVRRNIKKSVQYGCHTRKNIPIDPIIELAKNYSLKHIAADYERFLRLFNYLQKKEQALTYGVYSSSHELVASCVFFFGCHRAYYILVGNHPNGKTLGASHALIDAFIKDHAGQDLTLDFEGSDIRNLAFFYSSFGASEERYLSLQENRLPWYIKWLKK